MLTQMPKLQAEPAMAPNSTSLAGVALLLFLAPLLQAAQGGAVGLAGGGERTRPSSSSGYVPVRTVVYRSAGPTAATAEAYEPFELCMGCRCCPAAAGSSSNSSSCVDTRCCYAIDCNIPGKPFGVCAFSPRTCGCGANNCTKPA